MIVSEGEAGREKEEEYLYCHDADSYLRMIWRERAGKGEREGGEGWGRKGERCEWAKWGSAR
eukprot:509882-Rhodomonas_salina.1